VSRPLAFWLDESDKRRLVASRIDGVWCVRLSTHGCVAPRTTYVEVTGANGATFDETVEEALAEIARLNAATVSP
jgi:hypothetical protein